MYLHTEDHQQILIQFHETKAIMPEAGRLAIPVSKDTANTPVFFSIKIQVRLYREGKDKYENVYIQASTSKI